MTFLKGSFFVFFLNLRSTYKQFFFQLEVRAYSKSFKNVIVFWTEFCSLPLFRKKIYMLDEKFRKNLSLLARNEKTNSKHKYFSFFGFQKYGKILEHFTGTINFFLLNIHKNELCFSSSGRPNLKGQVCKLASRNGNFFPRLIFCSLKQKVAALLHFTVPLCFCVEVVGATIIYKSWELGFLIIIHF